MSPLPINIIERLAALFASCVYENDQLFKDETPGGLTLRMKCASREKRFHFLISQEDEYPLESDLLEAISKWPTFIIWHSDIQQARWGNTYGLLVKIHCHFTPPYEDV